MALVERKAKAGETEEVEPVEPDEAPAKPSNVVDLTELLKRSLKKGAAKEEPAVKAPAKRKRA